MVQQIGESKPDLSIIDPEFIEQLALVLSYGAKKYNGVNKWVEYKDINALVSATLRHIDKFRVGEELDSESGLPHLSHATANIMMLQSLLKNGALSTKNLYFNNLFKNK